MILETETNIYDPEAIAKVLKSEETKLEIQRGVISALISEEERAEYLSGQKTITTAFNSLKMTIDSTVNQISQIKDDLHSYEAKNAMYVQALDHWSNELSYVRNTANTAIEQSSGVAGDINSIKLWVTKTESKIGKEGANAYTRSDIEVTNDGVVMSVQKKDNFTGSLLVSKINQSADTVKINASHIKLTGYVTAASLTASGTTEIDGSRITTGLIQSKDGTCSWKLSGPGQGTFINANSLGTKSMDIKGGNIFFYKGTGGNDPTWYESGYISSDSTYDYPGGTQLPGLRIGTMGGLCLITPTLGIADPREGYNPGDDISFYNALSEILQVVGGIRLSPVVEVDGQRGHLIQENGIDALNLSFTLGMLTAYIQRD